MVNVLVFATLISWTRHSSMVVGKMIDSILVEIEFCRIAKEQAKAAEERRKTVIVGDMQPLADALPSLAEDTIPSK